MSSAALAAAPVASASQLLLLNRCGGLNCSDCNHADGLVSDGLDLLVGMDGHLSMGICGQQLKTSGYVRVQN